jgi:hypothetical protein
MMLHSRNPATWSWPTQNRVSRSPRAGNNPCPLASKMGAISTRLPASRSVTKTNGGTSPIASFISGQLSAQERTMTVR